MCTVFLFFQTPDTQPSSDELCCINPQRVTFTEFLRTFAMLSSVILFTETVGEKKTASGIFAPPQQDYLYFIHRINY